MYVHKYSMNPKIQKTQPMYVCQSRMSYFGYVAEDRTKWNKGR